MKKKKKLIGIIIILLIIVSLFFLFLFFRNKKDSLTLQQRQWIENNSSYVIDISVLNDIPAYTYNGQGLVFDFLDYVSKDTGLSFKPVAITSSIKVENDYSFDIIDNPKKSDIVLDQDNYVLINKLNLIYHNINQVSNQKIGVLESDLKKFKGMFNDTNQLVGFKSKTEMISSEEITSFIILKSDAMDYMVKNNSKISYQFSDKKYYVIRLNGDEVLNEILRKYYERWEDNFYTSYNTSLLNDYYQIAKISDKDQVDLKNHNYVYGFVNNGIYDSLKGRKLFGINQIIIKSFSEFSGVTVKHKTYKNINELDNDFSSNNISIMVNNDLNNKKTLAQKNKKDNSNYKIVDVLQTDLFVVSKNNSDVYVKNISDLKDYTIYTVKNSKVEALLKDKDIKVKAFADFNDLIKHANNNAVLVIERDNFDYYKTRYFKNYRINYTISAVDYGYKVNIKNDKLFGNLFGFYVNYVNIDKLISSNYKNIAYTTIDYSLIFIIMIIVIALGLLLKIVGKFKKFIKKIIEKRKNTLSKEEKLKYIDQLTSLKNRAYLNTKVEQWDESETYPQAVIIVDLNNIAFINDNYGREEGDKIIRDAANILIQTQIPNTEIIRTDGNEFLIYAVGYREKEIISYLRKLSKSLKTLSHGFGAATGYSMILDAIKTFDDAVNEATIEMKQSKEDSLNK